jgi:hypothetical protein
MATAVGNVVHPWYKGTHEWLVEAISELQHSIEYTAPIPHVKSQKTVEHDIPSVSEGEETNGR